MLQYKNHTKSKKHQKSEALTLDQQKTQEILYQAEEIIEDYAMKG